MMLFRICCREKRYVIGSKRVGYFFELRAFAILFQNRHDFLIFHSITKGKKLKKGTMKNIGQNELKKEGFSL